MMTTKICITLAAVAWLVGPAIFLNCLISQARTRLAGKAGAIDAVVAAMRAHVDNAGVSESSCGALNKICFKGSFPLMFALIGLT
jgi:hypothetical protein